MSRFRQRLTSRTSVLTLMLACVGMMLVIAAVPPASGGKATGVGALGIGRVSESSPFIALLAACLVVLSVATWGLLRRDARRIRGGARPTEAHGFPVQDTQAFSDDLRRAGYLRMHSSGPGERFVKHPWGLAAGSVLHVGLIIVLGAGIVLSLTRAEGLLLLAEGENSIPDEPLLLASHGPLGGDIVLHDSIVLVDFEAEFWETGEPKRLASELVVDSGTDRRTLDVEVNHPVTYDGIRIYQDQQFGHSAFLSIVLPDGEATLRRADIPQPAAASRPSYADIDIAGIGTLQLKCTLDDPAGDDPLIVARLSTGAGVSEEATLGGEAVRLGELTVSLDATRRWSAFVLTRASGIGWLFSGFLLVALGGLLLYLTPPREVLLGVREDGSAYATWRAWRLPKTLEGERAVLARMAGEDDGL